MVSTLVVTVLTTVASVAMSVDTVTALVATLATKVVTGPTGTANLNLGGPPLASRRRATSRRRRREHQLEGGSDSRTQPAPRALGFVGVHVSLSVQRGGRLDAIIAAIRCSRAPTTP